VVVRGGWLQGEQGDACRVGKVHVKQCRVLCGFDGRQVRLCVVNMLTFRWWYRLLLSLAIFQLRLQQQWCIPPTATVWRIQTLARRTVARGIVDQRLLRRRTGAYRLRRDKVDLKRHPAAADMLRGGPTDKPG